MPSQTGKDHAALLAHWAIALAEDSPVLVVPWHDDAGRVAYIDLRAHPEHIHDIPEAGENPALARVLEVLNASGSPWATAKCDRWALDEDDLDTASFDLALARNRSVGHVGIGSYIDFYYREVKEFASLEHHRELLPRLTRRAEGFDEAGVRRDGHPVVMLELTLRRCVAAGSEGYAITAFLYAIGEDAARAQANWEAALGTLAHILLSGSAHSDRMKVAGE